MRCVVPDPGCPSAAGRPTAGRRWLCLGCRRAADRVPPWSWPGSAPEAPWTLQGKHLNITSISFWDIRLPQTFDVSKSDTASEHWSESSVGWVNNNKQIWVVIRNKHKNWKVMKEQDTFLPLSPLTHSHSLDSERSESQKVTNSVTSGDLHEEKVLYKQAYKWSSSTRLRVMNRKMEQEGESRPSLTCSLGDGQPLWATQVTAD